MMQFPPRLTHEEEADLIAAMRNGDRAARDKLIVHNFRIAHKIAILYRLSGLEYSDRFQIACCGLIRAVDEYMAVKSYALSTAMFNYTKNALRDAWRKERKSPMFCAVPFDKIIGGQCGFERSKAYADLFESDDPDPLDQVVSSEDVESVRNAVDALPDELRQIVQMRYSDDSELSQMQVGRQIGLSQMTVCRRERQALEMCRERLKCS